MTPNKRPPHSLSDNDMDPESARALSLRLLPGLLAFAQRKRWAAPRPVTPQELVQFQILVAAMIITATPGTQPSATARDNIPRREPNIFSTLRSLDKQMDNYENKELLDLAREEIPMERIRAEATALQQSDSPLACEEDALAHVLVHWFKHEYFKWADPIKCPRCGGKTSVAGMVPPAPYERDGGAGRVELHVCEGENGACDGSFRFARYNDLKYLMRTRIGRCGEWANLYTISLHDLQLVWNKEDHVWNEYFSPAAGRWIHTDSCEAARDQPLLYDRGWGKKMSYVFAFSVDGASDMSRGYVQNSNEMFQRRHDAPEPALAEEFAKIRTARRRDRTPTDLARLEQEDKVERDWLANSDERAAREEETKKESEPARESGTQDWKEARGEAGPGSR
ncbi:peptide-N4-(N-acetyl-beta-glucosaminyl)asparagineamidase [Rhizoctonia solani AG-1 IB]|uniref:Peptide-N4-(N-acetyl-beta-glucosaminyl)asparagine amidase n=1 Tax=Thanatephorus cucumeris (strain AG1-IB / isolate 7/3/14) TaxID=1108050 RepID=A0A0B7FI64_THACB|nr:peptide-N4-(N-acetyl-beta-glucosaminyl)asparagineamidase [Rhizoctonia solani AG-1 IB]